MDDYWVKSGKSWTRLVWISISLEIYLIGCVAWTVLSGPLWFAAIVAAGAMFNIWNMRGTLNGRRQAKKMAAREGALKG